MPGDRSEQIRQLKQQTLHNLMNSRSFWGLPPKRPNGEADDLRFADPKHVQKYLDQQKQEGALGTHIELQRMALDEKVNVVVTAIPEIGKPYEFVIRGSDDDDAPLRRIRCERNVHFESVSSNVDTTRDGNCLYDAWLLERAAQSAASQRQPTPVTSAATTFGHSHAEAQRKEQKEIRQLVKGTPKPSEDAAADQAYAERMRAKIQSFYEDYPPEVAQVLEQDLMNQIRADDAVARQMARDGKESDTPERKQYYSELYNAVYNDNKDYQGLPSMDPSRFGKPQKQEDEELRGGNRIRV